jgi:hypothetical protein
MLETITSNNFANWTIDEIMKGKDQLQFLFDAISRGRTAEPILAVPCSSKNYKIAEYYAAAGAHIPTAVTALSCIQLLSNNKNPEL